MLKSTFGPVLPSVRSLSNLQVLQPELKESAPDETFDLLRFPGVAEKHVDFLYVLLYLLHYSQF